MEKEKTKERIIKAQKNAKEGRKNKNNVEKEDNKVKNKEKRSKIIC